MAAQSYALDTEDLKVKIEDFFKENTYEGKLFSNGEDNDKIIYTVFKENSEVESNCKITFFLKNDGRVSFSCQGKMSNEICSKLDDFILSSFPHANKNKYKKNLYNVRLSNFKIIVDKMSCLYSVTEDNKGDNGTHYSFSCNRNRSIKVILYEKKEHSEFGNLIVEGYHFPSLFDFFKCFIEVVGLGDFNKSMVNCSDYQIEERTAVDYLKNHFGDKLDDLPHIYNLIFVDYCSIKIFSKEAPPFKEFGSFCINTCKALEGAIRDRILYLGGNPEENQNTGSWFCNGALTLDLSTNTNSDKIKVKENVEFGYAVFKKHRNGLMHVDYVVESSKKIETFEEAEGIFKEIFSAIKRVYS